MYTQTSFIYTQIYCNASTGVVRQDQAAERTRRVAGVVAVLRSAKSPTRRASSVQSASVASAAS
jgi:hypothetical protein